MSSLMSLGSSFVKSMTASTPKRGEKAPSGEIVGEQNEGSPEITFLVQGKHRKPKTPAGGAQGKRRKKRGKSGKNPGSASGGTGTGETRGIPVEGSERPADSANTTPGHRDTGEIARKHTSSAIFSPLAQRNANSSSPALASVEAKVDSGLKKRPRASPQRSQHRAPKSPEEHLAMLMSNPVSMEEDQEESEPKRDGAASQPPSGSSQDASAAPGSSKGSSPSALSNKPAARTSPVKTSKAAGRRSGASTSGAAGDHGHPSARGPGLGPSPVKRSVRFAPAAEMKSPPGAAVAFSEAQSTPLPASPPDAPSSGESAPGSGSNAQGTKSKVQTGSRRKGPWTPGITRARKMQAGSTPGIGIGLRKSIAA